MTFASFPWRFSRLRNSTSRVIIMAIPTNCSQTAYAKHCQWRPLIYGDTSSVAPPSANMAGNTMTMKNMTMHSHNLPIETGMRRNQSYRYAIVPAIKRQMYCGKKGSCRFKGMKPQPRGRHNRTAKVITPTERAVIAIARLPGNQPLSRTAGAGILANERQKTYMMLNINKVSLNHTGPSAIRNRPKCEVRKFQTEPS